MQHKTLVTGTTSDYIDWLRASCPGKPLFITHPDIRKSAKEASPQKDEEILAPLSDKEQVLLALKAHLKTWGQALDGIFCFDCENMELTSFIGQALGLSYPSTQAILNARDKYISKQLWQAHDVGCPKTSPVNSAQEAHRFFLSAGSSGVVLKPFTGSGSELVFLCKTPSECQTAFDTIERELANRNENPLFKRDSSKEHLMLGEEYISGPEYSCDFIIENDRVQIIRLAQKIKSTKKPFGTIQGYILPCILPEGISWEGLQQTLYKGALALGISRAICMVDFILSGTRINLIEMTPRPGGDCLPHMLKSCFGLDMLQLSLDFAAGKPVPVIDIGKYLPCMAIRIHATEHGILHHISHEALMADDRVRSLHLSKAPGHRIVLPPKDYDSWLLGHIIMSPSAKASFESQAEEILEKLDIVVEKKDKGTC